MPTTELRCKGKMLKEYIRNSIPVLRKIVPNNVWEKLQEQVLYNPVKERYANAPLFNHVFFELRSKCNNSCSFCPANIYADTREDITMPMDLYKKAIQELKELNFSGRVNFYLNNEPLIVKKLFEYIEYAVSQLDKARKFQILTNGLALTKEKSRQLLESGITSINVNWYHDNFESSLPKNIIEFKGMVKEFNQQKRKKVVLVIQRRKITEVLTNRSGDAPKKNNDRIIPLRGFCEYPFSQFAINPEGKVSLCCNDVYYKSVLGDIRKEKIGDIWNNRAFQNARKNLWDGNRGNLDMCKYCDHYGLQPGKINTIFKKLIYYLTRDY